MSQPTLPAVTVVMGVYNNAEFLERTIASVLAQTSVDLQFVIVDDGSDQTTKALLARYKTNPKVEIITQPNQGLTAALICGCGAARAPYIARIDVGDEMLPHRLVDQVSSLEQHPDAVLTTSPVTLHVAEGETLFNVDYTQEDLTAGVASANSATGKIPFHASVMFRADVYRRVGGYRQEFYFAQDLDLWSRMIEHGEIVVSKEPLTKGLILPHGISAEYTREQQQCRQIIAKLQDARRTGAAEESLLRAVAEIRPKHRKSAIRNAAAGYYFIGKCLLDRRSALAKQYLRTAIQHNPYRAKHWFAWLQSLFRRMKQTHG